MDIVLSLTLKENTISNFLLYSYVRNSYRQKNSYKLKLNTGNWHTCPTELSLNACV